ncbi:MAG: gamma-glutamyl-phosphate reductase, partial [Epsilonproteobacteria bacterium]|nr:gamma-glutamyl-phosphate reductase [Campylobacterota bacterium]
MQTFLEHAKAASKTIATLDPRTKVSVLMQMADALEKNADTILAEKEKDLQ